MRTMGGAARGRAVAPAPRREMNVHGLGHMDSAPGAHEEPAQMIPAAELLDGHAEAVRNGDERVSTADTIEGCSRGGGSGSDRDDDSVDAAEIGGGGELVDLGEIRHGDLEGAGDVAEAVAGGERVVAPVAALVDGDLGDALLEELFGAFGKVELKGLVGRSGSAEQTGVEAGDLLKWSADEIRDEGQADAVVGLHGVIDERRIGSEIVEAVLFGVLRHDGDGEEDGYIVLGFSG